MAGAERLNEEGSPSPRQRSPRGLKVEDKMVQKIGVTVLIILFFLDGHLSETFRV